MRRAIGKSFFFLFFSSPLPRSRMFVVRSTILKLCGDRHHALLFSPRFISFRFVSFRFVVFVRQEQKTMSKRKIKNFTSADARVVKSDAFLPLFSSLHTPFLTFLSLSFFSVFFSCFFFLFFFFFFNHRFPLLRSAVRPPSVCIILHHRMATKRRLIILRKTTRNSTPIYLIAGTRG